MDTDCELVTIPCPHCGKHLGERLDRLRRDAQLICSACRRISHVSTHQLQAALAFALASRRNAGKREGRLRLV
ncbi:hypothetical protein [Nitrosovibrio sp. Nv17]|uniref:hypothetical protein n=1 Tax=Nitrosovibrio sp. Nv17 TaxID=1855339 RepID=UPI000908E2B4|nr:hypothetical protein [Nitrosovibrio sp. Nv17]SFW14094.1 hypothetical protein SAMN05216414_102119 [Nitrosovibrio sp. Nv17]